MPRKEFDSLNYSMVDLFENDDHSLAETFHESTKLNRKNYGQLSHRVEQISRNGELIVMMTRSWKSYASSEKIALPEGSLGGMTLIQALLQRRSQLVRFGGGSINLDQLGAVLRFSYGITSERKIPSHPEARMRFRAAPSAGGLYPVEIYPIVFDVEGCAPGVYHYSVLDHSLEVLRRGPIREEFLQKEVTPYRDLASTCAVMFALTAVIPRTVTKYLFRGYRFLSNDVGALVQNLYLTGTALGLGTCAVGGFFDNEVGDFLGVDNVDESVMLLFALGQPYAEPAKSTSDR